MTLNAGGFSPLLETAILANMELSSRLRFILFVTVFLTGAAVLIFEVAAVRLLAPYFGSSLYVLSSVLSTILLALSIGYTVGGRLADRYPNTNILFGIIAIAGVIMTILLTLALYILPAMPTSFNPAYGPLVVSFACFFVPALLLGMDSPFVVKLLTRQSADNTEGQVVGNVFFWSTIGSITGSLLAGFFLIPTFGLTETITATAVLLTLWAGLALAGTTTSTAYRVVAIVFIISSLVCGGMALRVQINTDPDITTLHVQNGLYSRLEVFERSIGGTTYRFLKNDTNHSSAIIPGSTDVAFPYASYALLFPAMVPAADSYLVLGGGAFTMPRHIHERFPQMRVDTVEVEPYLLPIAKEYFGYTTAPTLAEHTTDARTFLTSTTTQYDMIFSDVMNSGHFTPPHLMTAEFFASLQARLDPNGVAILNYIGSTDTTGLTLTGSLLRTISTVFPNYRLLAIHDPEGKRLQNLLIILRHENLPITFGDTLIQNYLYQYKYPADSRFVSIPPESLADEMIFTDNHSQVELLTQKQFRLHGR